MASPQVPPQVPFDPRYYRRYRRRSLAGPVILIGVGVCFLLANMHVISASRIGWLFATWWPLLLILLGVIRIVEYAIARSEGGPAPRLGGGAVALLVVFVVLGVVGNRVQDDPGAAPQDPPARSRDRPGEDDSAICAIPVGGGNGASRAFTCDVLTAAPERWKGHVSSRS